MGSLGGDFAITCVLVDGNGDSFVEEAEEAFDNDRFMIAFECGLAWYVEAFAHSFKVFAERGASVRGNLEAKTDTEEDIFHERFGKGGGVEGVNINDNGEGGEVAHSGEDVL